MVGASWVYRNFDIFYNNNLHIINECKNLPILFLLNNIYHKFYITKLKELFQGCQFRSGSTTGGLYVNHMETDF